MFLRFRTFSYIHLSCVPRIINVASVISKKGRKKKQMARRLFSRGFSPRGSRSQKGIQIYRILTFYRSKSFFVLRSPFTGIPLDVRRYIPTISSYIASNIPCTTSRECATNNAILLTNRVFPLSRALSFSSKIQIPTRRAPIGRALGAGAPLVGRLHEKSKRRVASGAETNRNFRIEANERSESELRSGRDGNSIERIRGRLITLVARDAPPISPRGERKRT